MAHFSVSLTQPRRIFLSKIARSVPYDHLFQAMLAILVFFLTIIGWRQQTVKEIDSQSLDDIEVNDAGEIFSKPRNNIKTEN